MNLYRFLFSLQLSSHAAWESATIHLCVPGVIRGMSFPRSPVSFISGGSDRFPGS